MTTPTTSAIPSHDPRDLLFNAEKLDEIVNGGGLTYLDRFGIQHSTLAGAVASIASTNNRGAWVTATAYAVNDLVLQSGTWYICIVAHTSSAAFATDLATKWRVFQGVINSDLADITDPLKGAGMSGLGDAVAYALSTVGGRLLTFEKNVLAFGAKTDGATDSASFFNTAGATGKVIAVPELPNNTPYVLNSDVAGVFYAVGTPRFSGTGKIAIVPELGTALSENNFAVVGSFPRTCSMLIVGDSITAGTGAPTFAESSGWHIARSLMNASDRGIFQDSGIGYHRILRNASFITSPGVTYTGSDVNTGAFQSRMNLASGQSLSVTLREITTFDVLYDASTSSGTFEIRLNGVAVKTVTVSGTGFKSTFPTTLKASGFLTRLSDVITVACTSGSLRVLGIMDLKNSAVNDMLLYVGATPGLSFSDLTSSGAMDEMAFYLNNIRSGNDKVLVLNLGTNAMTNVSKAKLPPAMITDIDTIVTGMRSRCTTLQIVLSVPPRSNESLFPIQVAAKYEEYVKAIVSYAIRNGCSLIRHDLSALNNLSYFVDGLHPNAIGHKVFAQTVLDTLRVKYDAFFKSTDFNLTNYLTQMRTDAAIVPISTWAAYAGSATEAPRAHAVAGVVHLSGVLQKNGSSSLNIGTIPAFFRPDTATRFFLAAKDVAPLSGAGVVGLSVDTSGVISISSLPTDNVSLDGISYPLQKYIET